MMEAISMRELQKMSAAKIRALPHAVPIRSGDEVVGTLVPKRVVDRDTVERALAAADAWRAQLSDEDREYIDKFLDELER